MLAKDEFQVVSLRCTVSLQGGWPMVEHALQQPRAPIRRSSEADEQAARMARSVEARSGLSRTGGGGPPSLDRDMARALVDAGYMPLADYVALYGDNVAAGERLPPAVPQPLQKPMRISGQFSVAFPRRPTYRTTIVRYTFAKPTRRRARPKRRA